MPSLRSNEGWWRLMVGTYLPTNTMNNCFPILEESITIKTRWLDHDPVAIKISNLGYFCLVCC